MSPTLAIAARRTAVADLCERLGLTMLGAEIETKRGDMPGVLREMLLRVRIAAVAIHAAAAFESLSTPVDVLVRMAANAQELERAVSEALVVCDQRIAELHADNAKGVSPGLAMSAKPMGGWR